MSEQEQSREVMNIVNIKTDQLKPNDYNPNAMSNEDFAELVAEVKHLGRLPKPVFGAG
jgi:ParB-like chromosome segregation protein Spo0J